MKKKILGGICAAVSLAFAALGVAACGGREHTHTVSSEWSFDEYYHYHEASCGSVNHREDVTEHEGDVCFCGYDVDTFGKPTGGDTPGVDDGESNFGSLTLSSDGTLEFNKVKGAVKYVLELTYSGSDKAVAYDIDRNDNSVKLDELASGGFPAGKTQATLTAWEMYKEDIEGETIEQEVPMDGISDSFRIIKLNGEFELVRLGYKDDYIDLQGFTYDAETESYCYELALTSNKDTRFNVSKYAKPVVGGAVNFYRTSADRENGENALSSNDLLFQYARHGENKYYVDAVNADGNGKHYDLCIYGLYKLEVERLAVSYTQNDNGTRNYSYSAIGTAFSVTERDIVTQDVLFDGVDADFIGRDGAYNVIERGDLLITSDTERVTLYFYDEDQVLADCDEYAQVSQVFSVTDAGNYVTLYAGYDVAGEVTVPFAVVGKVVAGATFSNSEVTVVRVAEGATAFVCVFQQCNAITDIYLPSTIADMARFSFGQNDYTKVPDTAVIHCAFDKTKADSFDSSWNQISGGFKYYTTRYDGSGSTGGETENAYSADGVNYAVESGSAIVIGVTKKFGGIIPDEVELGSEVYRVTAIRSMGDHRGDVEIGKFVETIEKTAFSCAAGKLSVKAGNTAFKVENGILYSADGTRIVVAQNDLKYAYIDDTVTEIDRGALNFKNGRCELYFAIDDLSGTGFEYHDARAWTGVRKEIKDDIVYMIKPSYGSIPAEALVAEYIGNSTHITIAETVGGANVVGSAFNGALADVNNITKITLPFGMIRYNTSWIELFGDDATMPTLEYIEYTGRIERTMYSFDYFDPGYENIVRIDISQDNGSFVADGDMILSGDMTYIVYVQPSAKTLIVPSSVLYLDKSMPSVESITLLGADTMVSCYEWTSLKSITLAEGMTEISDSAFSGCTALETVNLPSTIETIGRSAFYNCRKLVNINMPASLKTIGESAFRDCRSLKSVVIPASIEKVDGAAFAGCTSLESVTIPANVTQRDTFISGTFKYCGKLKAINYNGTKKQFDAIFKTEHGYVMYGLTDDSYVLKIVCTDGEITVEET